jgi:hypothetical protein
MHTPSSNDGTQKRCMVDAGETMCTTKAPTTPKRRIRYVSYCKPQLALKPTLGQSRYPRQIPTPSPEITTILFIPTNGESQGGASGTEAYHIRLTTATSISVSLIHDTDQIRRWRWQLQTIRGYSGVMIAFGIIHRTPCSCRFRQYTDGRDCRHANQLPLRPHGVSALAVKFYERSSVRWPLRNQ